jgi:hypothetical protein
VEALAALYPPLTKYCPILPTLSPQQLILLGYQGREALYGGAVGGGKSAGLLASALRFVDRKGYAALLLRRTYAELSMSGGLIPLSHEWLGPTDAVWNEGKKTWTFPSGATLQFGHVQHETDRFNYQGAAYQFVGFDELTHFTEAIYLYIGFSRQRRRMDIADIPVQTFASANPGGVGHIWVKRRFLDHRDPNVLFVPARVDDNPGLDRADYEASLVHLPVGLRKQLMEGDWNAFEGAAYQEFDESVHVVPVFPAPPQWERFEFMDHGTANPAAWYLCLVDYDGNLVVFDSYYSPGLISEHAAEILARRPAWYPEWTDLDGRSHVAYPTTIADPAVTTRIGTLSKNGEPATIATEYADQSNGRIVLTPGNNDRQAGKARIQELLRCDPERPFPEWHPRRGERGAPRLYIVGQRCPELVEQLKSAPLLALDSGRKGAGEVVDPEWETQYGHAHAALRYGVMSRPDATAPGEGPESEDPRRAFLDRIIRKEREGLHDPEYVYVDV